MITGDRYTTSWTVLQFTFILCLNINSPRDASPDCLHVLGKLAQLLV
ncbi:hypothetical protein [Laspinema palackyanum]